MNIQVNEKEIDFVVSQLKSIHSKLTSRKDEIFYKIVEPKEEVFSRFQPMFDIKNLPNLTELDFREFLMMENNKHWTGLHRSSPKLCSDMSKLRRSLEYLLDESKPISDRVDYVFDNMNGMGKAIITAILIIVHPDKYGVWNKTSEEAMKRLKIFPQFDRGEPFGNRYVKVNELLSIISNKLELDLWTLDALWESVDTEDDEIISKTTTSVESEKFEKVQRFGLERHLHEFLRDNWKHTVLGEEWEIYSEPGDEEAGYEYPCDIGRIDILAHHKTEPGWLVAELKRDQSSDQTVGQLLRYIGWVQTHMCENNEIVNGMVIAHSADDSIKYALKPMSNVELKLYEVEFKLKNPE